jgi:hypothetical protein
MEARQSQVLGKADAQTERRLEAFRQSVVHVREPVTQLIVSVAGRLEIGGVDITGAGEIHVGVAAQRVEPGAG